jgi:hypothetical protein
MTEVMRFEWRRAVSSTCIIRTKFSPAQPAIKGGLRAATANFKR